jgi:hypothetical protein
MSKLSKFLCGLGKHDYAYTRIVADAGLTAGTHELKECRYCPAIKCVSEHRCHKATYEERKALES